MTTHTTALCLSCCLLRPISGRGLCSTCYSRSYRAGTLEEFSRSIGADSAVWVEEYQFLRRWGLSDPEIARKLGIPTDTLQAAVRRHERKQASIK